MPVAQSQGHAGKALAIAARRDRADRRGGRVRRAGGEPRRRGHQPRRRALQRRADRAPRRGDRRGRRAAVPLPGPRGQRPPPLRAARRRRPRRGVGRLRRLRPGRSELRRAHRPRGRRSSSTRATSRSPTRSTARGCASTRPRWRTAGSIVDVNELTTSTTRAASATRTGRASSAFWTLLGAGAGEARRPPASASGPCSPPAAPWPTPRGSADVEGGALGQPHGGGGDLAQPLVGQADHAGLEHVGVLLEHLLHLEGVHAVAAVLDHVLLPALEHQQPERTAAGEVAGAEPAVLGEHRRRSRRRRPSTP